MTEMKKLEKEDMQSADIVKENIGQLKQLFPEVFSEDKINFEKLEEILGNYVNQDEDHYNFTWHGKKKAARLAQTPSTGTLRPAKDESVDFDNTQNLFIEGDNLEVLKLLQKSYHRQVKMIYIDPPYNTGNDFVYEDDFRDGVKNYLEMTGQIDGEGKKFGTNSSSAGRYHTNWLNMMYPRLKLARNLLRDDGVIFISIDDNEQANLKKLCDEVFGEDNMLGTFIWKKTENIKMDSKFFSQNKDYVLCYKKGNLEEFNKILSSEERYNLEDEKGKYYLRKLEGKHGYTKSLDYIIEYDGRSYYAGGSYEKWKVRQEGGATSKDPRWLWSKTKFEVGLKNNEIVFKNGNVYNKVRYDGVAKKPYVDFLNTPSGQTAQKELDRLFGGKRIFDHPKPTDLVGEFLKMTYSTDCQDLILDFFSGSATTAHAVMQLNAEDGGNRKCISVQLPEKTDEKSEAFKAGYKNIAEISKERIRRAAKKIKQENPGYQGDLGFKVFKLDSSNIKRWDASFDNLEQNLIDAVDYIKQDRSNDDIVYEILLKYGLDLAVPIETKEIAGTKIYIIGFGALVICLDKNINMEVVNGICTLKTELSPEIMRVVFSDNGFRDDVIKTNAIATLKRAGIEDIKSL